MSEETNSGWNGPAPIDERGNPMTTQFDRLKEMKQDALRILDEARKEHFANHDMTGCVVLFSGGNDSTVLAHLMRPHCSHFGHANTGIGVEQTRQFVRDVANEWHIPLLEFKPDPGDRYEDLVIEHGFPGPAHHFKMYQRLKERQIRKIRRQLVTNPRKERVMLVAGRRRDESERRKGVPEFEREGSAVWVSPLANWTDADMKAYRAAHPDIPHNEVTDHLHMSGECLCLAFGSPGEEELIRFFYPEIGDQIDGLAEKARANGISEERCRWGWGAYRGMTPEEREAILESTRGTLCETCDYRLGATQ